MKILALIRTKRIVSALILVAIMWFAGSSAQAQQPAGSTQPTTQNPQTSGQVFPQQSQVQDTENQQLLNTQRRIVIPSGTPAEPAEQEDDQTSYMLWIALLSGVGAAVLFWVVYRSRHQIDRAPAQGVAPPEASALPESQTVSGFEPSPEEPKESKPAKAKSPEKKRANIKAKRAKRKRKKKH